jgi:hypothetical protein
MNQPITREFPKETPFADLAKEVTDRLEAGALRCEVRDEGTHWLLVTHWKTLSGGGGG